MSLWCLRCEARARCESWQHAYIIAPPLPALGCPEAQSSFWAAESLCWAALLTPCCQPKLHESVAPGPQWLLVSTLTPELHPEPRSTRVKLSWLCPVSPGLGRGAGAPNAPVVTLLTITFPRVTFFIVGCIFLPGPAYPAPDGRCYMLSLTPDSHCYNHVTCHTIGGGGKVSCDLILSLRYLHTQSRVTRSQYNSRCN